MTRKNRKNSPWKGEHAYTFRLMSVSRDDPRMQNPESKEAPMATLKRLIPTNAFRKGKYEAKIPSSITSLFSPEDFGIHANLPERDKSSLYQEIYGSLSPTSSDALPLDSSLREALPLEANISLDLSSSSRLKNAAEEGYEVLEVDKISFIERLELEDCYFPLDGYNYEKHLRALNTDATLWRSPQINITKEEDIEENNTTLQELHLDGIDSESNPEELEDDFVKIAEALEDEPSTTLESFDHLLWGSSRKSSHPPSSATNLSPLQSSQCLSSLRNSSHATYSLPSKISSEGDLKKKVHFSLQKKVSQSPESLPSLDAEDEILTSSQVQSLPLEDFSIPLSIRDDKILFPLGNEEIDKIKKLTVLQMEKDPIPEESSLFPLEEEEQRWDCETILTTRTTASHHPLRLPTLKMPSKPIKMDMKMNMPVEFIPERKTTQSIPFESQQEEEIISLPEIITTRPKGETSEDRKQRKSKVKEMKRIIRTVKGQNQNLLKEERKAEKIHKEKQNPFDLPPGIRYFKI